jgi:hypothetical protein
MQEDLIKREREISRVRWATLQSRTTLGIPLQSGKCAGKWICVEPMIGESAGV